MEHHDGTAPHGEEALSGYAPGRSRVDDSCYRELFASLSERIAPQVGPRRLRSA